MKRLIAITFAIIVSATLIYCQKTSSGHSSEKPIAANFKTYSNIKYGFSFKFPSEWQKVGTDREVINRTGVVSVVEIDFKDTLSQTALVVNYHFAPAGTQIYQYAASSKGNKQIDVAGIKAIELTSIIKTDGRGDSLSIPLKVVVVHILDKETKNEIELQFTTPVSTEKIELPKFKSLLTTFKFK